MNIVRLRKASSKDKAIVVGFYNSIEQEEPFSLKREKKIANAILDEACFIILANRKAIGFVIFDYRFFDQGWIELIILDEAYRGKGIGGKVFDLLGEQCKAGKLFTSTNRSNTRMQKALAKAGFSFAGQLTGLDEGDPELFYYRLIKEENQSTEQS
ncbi:GNAT family N-acetyltransferase [Phaeodactylibacter sp.]|uniref:GNAT family N-acetyltransferase n=1 Tax=Phaeodactylibacter sp. TaxID=1940289 RepID=UPI0025E950CA|nr:GNAT family N-acetyltransferase [Phaeodactylibacter sp.]MCI4650193.1 GNAT family N-acetyltransferase [Phaeodactylibacter sp.]MCI5089720.1 GNAT family N-acetyltransferase [Phaeodactylibacter sp.]